MDIFQIFNDKNDPIMRTEHKECIPNDRQLNSMVKAGCKFKINGKIVSMKQVKEFRDEK